MSRTNNFVTVTGRVISFKPKYTDSGKARAFYQIEVDQRAQDDTISCCPFIRSSGNVAKQDIENIKVGDIITVTGRIQTRKENKRIYLKVNELQPTENGELDELKLRVLDPNDENDKYSDDEKIYEAVVQHTVTEIYAEEVDYFSAKLARMSQKELARLIPNPTIAQVLEQYREKGITFDELLAELKKTH